MITDEEVMRVLERADPAQAADFASMIDADSFLDALHTRSATVNLIDAQATSTEPTNQHRWRFITAAAALVAVVAGGLVLAARDDDTETKTASAPPTTASTAAAATPAEMIAAEDVARRFLEAERGAFDADRASSYLEAEAFAEVAGTLEEYRLLLSFLEATGTKTLNIDCQHRDDTAVGIVIRCTYDHHMFRSDELGLGPYSGGYRDLTVRDDQIVAADGYAPLEPFSSQIWEPFKQWIAAEHPDDVPIMYEGGGWRISEQSIPLWQQRLREYAAPESVATRVGFVGLPPYGATPSTPARGELVSQYFVPKQGYQFATSVRLYADGRLIWSMKLPIPAGPGSTGYVEQRLTPEGVELVRTQQVITAKDPLRLPEWLPATAWDDQTITAYIPSSYAACLYVVGPGEPAQPDPPIEQELALLPTPAKDLLRGRQTVPYLVPPAGGTPNCLALTTQDARLLDTALSDAAFEQDEQRSAYVLNYHVDYPGLEGAQLHVSLEPVFPDGTISCSDCG